MPASWWRSAVPGDCLSQAVYVWTVLGPAEGRSFRYKVLDLQGATGIGGGSPGVAAAPGPAEAAGVQSPTKGGGMSEPRPINYVIQRGARGVIFYPRPSLRFMLWTLWFWLRRAA